MRIRTLIVPSMLVLAVAAAVAWAARSPVSGGSRAPGASADDVAATVDRVRSHLRESWADAQITPADFADELTVLRRLSLCLHGTIPSLEEVRQFEADTWPDRLDRWTQRMLADVRFADYFSERLARSFVGKESGAFIVFRRDRFVNWLSGELKENRPYDAIVREMLSQQGTWTDKPATNFVTAAFANDDIDENKLAGRAVRAFLGQRMDCAQCHDHPFAHWKQHDFEGLAAHFGQARLSIVGVEDKSKREGAPVEYMVQDRKTLDERMVAPVVPFGQEWLPAEGTRRSKLAAWITHPDNRRFERAAANRVWGLMFGKPYVQPVDDLPDPGDPDKPDLLDLLGNDFREHGCDLKRLIRVIAASPPFRLESAESRAEEAGKTDPARAADDWAAFPMVRLRPEQVIGSMLQATSVKTIDQNSHLIIRAIRFGREKEFVEEYGDLGDNELEDRTGTIPQALLRMNGKLSQETTQSGLLNASGRIASMAGSDERCLETCYLVCLSRRPTPDERVHFLAQLGRNMGQRRQAVEDFFWTLFNSPEFSWNH